MFYNSDDMQSLHPHLGKQIDKVRLHAVKIHAVGGNPKPTFKDDDPANYSNNYFIGNDQSKWASDVKLFSSVTYQNLYPDIDLKFYSSNTDIKYDVIVRAGANASAIELEYEGADNLSIKDGALLMQLSVGTIVEQKPYAYQMIEGKETEVACKFILKKNKISFYFPQGYDKSHLLIIDPTLIFSSYTGSTADNWGFTATFDAAGNVYAGGNVNNTGYPVTAGAYDLSYNGGGSGGNGWHSDIAIAKFNITGTSLLYATYLGGADNDQPQSLVVDGNDDLVIFGVTFSTNYPVTAGAFHTTNHGGSDMVISKLSTNGNTLLASTYVGGSADDGININSSFFTGGSLKYNYGDEARGEIIADANNNYIIGSCTKSSNFTTTSGVIQPGFGGGTQDGVLFKINSALTNMVWSTFVGGNNDDAVYDVVIDNSGNLYIAGGTNSNNLPTTPGVLHQTYQGGDADGFIAHITSTANSILALTYIGTVEYDQTYFVELDYSGNVYTTGQTEGSYPVTAGVYENAGSKQFIHKMNANLSSTFYSTVFGNGSIYPNISPTAFLVDTCENVYVAGWGRCISVGTTGDVIGMPVTGNAFQSTTDGCDFYFFVLNHDAQSLLYGTFFGGNLSNEHVDGGTSRFNKNGTIYESVCAGCGGHNDFPTTPGVVSNTNNSGNCNNGVIKLDFNLARTVSSITTSPNHGCAPFTLTFVNNSVNAVSYQWDFGDGSPVSTQVTPTHTFNNAGIYHVMLVAINNTSCNHNDTSYALITVTAPGSVNASFNLTQSSYCDSTAIVQFTGSGGNIFHLDFGDGFTTTDSSATHTYANPGTYIVTLIAQDSFCVWAADTVSQTVNIGSLVHSGINTNNVLYGCAPQTIHLTNTFTSTGNYFWILGDGTVSTATSFYHTYTDTGTYYVQLIVSDTTSCNLADTSSYTFHVYQNPVAGFTYDQPVFYFVNDNIHFYDHSIYAAFYNWDFGDGTSSADSVVVHQFKDGGTFDVCLLVTSINGCIDSTCAPLEILSSEMIYVPNAFTPNGDFKNDVFKVSYTGLTDLNVMIFDRWGEKIYEYNSLSGSWDGTYNGKPVAEDVYIWKLKAKGVVHDNIEKIGRVSVVR